jgi:hypothetical protein
MTRNTAEFFAMASIRAMVANFRTYAATITLTDEERARHKAMLELSISALMLRNTIENMGS